MLTFDYENIAYLNSKYNSLFDKYKTVWDQVLSTYMVCNRSSSKYTLNRADPHPKPDYNLYDVMEPFTK